MHVPQLNRLRAKGLSDRQIALKKERHLSLKVTIFARRLVYEALIEMNAFELSQLLLVKRAHPLVADNLTGPALPFCHSGFQGFDHLVSQ